MRIVMELVIVCVMMAAFSATCAADWKPQVMQQLNGKAARIRLQSRFQIVTEQANEVFGVPYMIYMPERDELLMLAVHDYPHMAALMTSKDQGATWSKPYYMRVDDQGNPTVGMQVGLAYLGGGKIITSNGYLSEDYGKTWPAVRPVPKECAGYSWDPMMVDVDKKSDKVTRVSFTGYQQEDPKQTYSSQGYFFFSTDEGVTWSEPNKVPQWKQVNEVALVRAKNGDLIAACRTDNSKRFVDQGIELDHYCGLAVSISKDNGKTWSDLNRLYEWGRHHPCMVVMPNGDIVMTYVVRLGYTAAADGLPQFGVEAVVSRDNGKTWDLDHKFLLASWKGNRTGENAWWASSQSTSTVILPGGDLLTVFGTGYRSQPGPVNFTPRDIGLVRWKLNNKGLNKDRTIRDAPWDSEARNVFNPEPLTQ